jgi:hypothetical protein
MTRWQRRVNRIWWRGFRVGSLIGVAGYGTVMLLGLYVPGERRAAHLSSIEIPTSEGCITLDSEHPEKNRRWVPRHMSDGSIKCFASDAPQEVKQ